MSNIKLTGLGSLFSTRCSCPKCKRSKRFLKITKKLPKADAKWMMDFYNCVIEEEEELGMLSALNKG